jgi:2-methylisocitrate lyase-like PEP mutase family enzyme
MSTTEQAAKAEAFRALHRGPPLLLMANAWDAITARLFEAEGFAAVATTSGGVSWAVGYADGEAAPWGEVVGQTARIARAVKVPVTADIEAGFGATPEALARSITDIIGAGAVGVNLEDGTPSPTPIRPIDEAAARIRAAREAATAAGVPIVINARTDLYLKQIVDEAGRFDEAVGRGRAYLAAGADCFYPIGLRDPATMGRLVQALKAPININVRAGWPSVAELEALGVARVTTATQLTLVALTAAREVARAIKATGRFDAINPAIGHPEMQQLMAKK